MVRKYRTLHLETLEAREVLATNPLVSVPESVAQLAQYAISGPTPEEQEMLELINRMRIDPQGELDRLIKSFSPLQAWDSEVSKALSIYPYPTAQNLISEWASLTPAAPLAWNLNLYVAATNHSLQMIQAGKQSHQLPGEPSLYDRILDAGYDPSLKPGGSEGEAIVCASENVYAYGRPARNGFSAASFTHAAFALDWGVPSHSHRDNIMSSAFTEVGISMIRETNPLTEIGEWVTTIDFAAPSSSLTGSGAYLLGVVYNDLNRSGYYEAGEGISSATVTVIPNNSESETFQFNPYQAGGYQVFLDNGLYTVTVTGPDFSGTIVKQVVIQGQNVKIDFTVQDISTQPPVLDLNGPDEAGIDHHTQFFENGSPCLLVSSAATLTDEDSRFLAWAEITLESRPNGLNEFLFVETSRTGLKSTYDAGTGKMLIFGDASVGDYLAVLKTLEYGNASEKADLSDRVISFVVSDGVNTSEIARSYVSVRQQTLETLTVSDVQIEEGDEGTTEMVFQFVLSDISRDEVYVEYELVDGTAVLGTHYFGDRTGILHFIGSQTVQTVRVEVPGDYEPGENLYFTLNIIGITGAVCGNTTATGTILDDDTPTELGTAKSWSVEDLDLTDGRRRLYSFTPTKSETVVWDAVLAQGGLGELTMQLYKTNHAGQPLTEVVEFLEHGWLNWEVEQGETYVLLIRGNVVLESLSMVYSPFVFDKETGIPSLELDPNRDDVVSIDYRNNILLYNGVELPIRFADYGGFQFRNVAPNHLLEIIVSGVEVFELDLENPAIPEDDGINIDDFVQYKYVVSSPSTAIRLYGTAGDDLFVFENGVAELTTSTNKTYTVKGNFFEVYGNGGRDQALIFDTIYDDSVYFESGKAVFVGGGDTGFNITVLDFARVDVSSLYGGRDTAYIVNTYNNVLDLDQWLIRRTEYNSTSDRNDVYCTWGFTEAKVYGDGDLGSPDGIHLRGGQEHELYVLPGQIVSTNASGTFRHEFYGCSGIRWLETSRSNETLTIHYEGAQEPGRHGTETNNILYFSGPRIVMIPNSVATNLFVNGTLTDINLLPGGFHFPQPVAEPQPVFDRFRTDSFLKTTGLFEEEDDWFDIVPKPLSIAEIALLYEDWD
ncbi:MAG: CAP domain-containing protein [Planctomycetaceae bacterium]|nr:CAP domain-containing protein [Planctomycetaceae bacterium]